MARNKEKYTIAGTVRLNTIEYGKGQEKEFLAALKDTHADAKDKGAVQKEIDRLVGAKALVPNDEYEEQVEAAADAGLPPGTLLTQPEGEKADTPEGEKHAPGAQTPEPKDKTAAGSKAGNK